jgi:hypothetical protein
VNELRRELQATKLPIDEPLQVEAAGGGMIGKSKAARTMACACTGMESLGLRRPTYTPQREGEWVI